MADFLVRCTESIREEETRKGGCSLIYLCTCRGRLRRLFWLDSGYVTRRTRLMAGDVHPSESWKRGMRDEMLGDGRGASLAFHGEQKASALRQYLRLSGAEGKAEFVRLAGDVVAAWQPSTARGLSALVPDLKDVSSA